MLVNKLKDESGVALIFAILMLALLSIIGLSATTNTDLELKMSGNEKSHKITFYGADAGNEVSKELIEQAIEARGWKNESGTSKTLGQITIDNKDFWLNPDLDPDPAVDSPSSANYDAKLTIGTGQNYLRVGTNGELSSGGAVQMAAGYEGVGKGAAGGGAWLIYDVRSRQEGMNNGRSQVKGEWLHVL